jgi:FlaA1/EpsC-like NDP-sugar epimerase/lipopolysaccharide/colanic/teichoic acid biosynthesis glycosyltransferase
MQRAFHFLIALIGLIGLLPVLILVAIAIKLTSRGPVLFRQERVGRHMKPFTMYKFRTMVVDAERRGPGVTVDGDARVTAIGRFLRATKLDEFPQLWNVVRGDMNLVGPRPELPRYVRLFTEEYRDILRVRPGITDVASITYRHESALLSGDADPEERYVQTILPDKLRLARDYVEHASLGYDLVLIAATLASLAYPARAVDRVLDALGRHHVGVTIVLQAALVVVANLAAAAIRFDGAPPADDLRLILLALPLLVVVRSAWFQVFNLYRDVWQYMGLRSLGSIIAAVALGSASFWGLITWAAPGAGYPRSVIVLDGLLCVMALTGIRVLRQMQREVRGHTTAPRRALVVGADDSAERILRGLMTHPNLDYRIVGIVGGDRAASGLSIHSVPIVGSYDQLEGIVREKTPDEVVVVASAVSEEQRREMVRSCRSLGKPVRVVPGLEQLLSGSDTAHTEPPRAEDLLFRDPIRVDLRKLEGNYRGHCVMVTGAGGSIGSEICVQVASCSPRRLVLFEKHEAGLYDIERRLRAQYPTLELVPVIGDIRDLARLEETFEAHRPQVVFHAAAYKHVPMMEKNPGEAIKTNVLGTKQLAETSERFGVGTFILISTDKAVEPCSVMGASKRMAELMVRKASIGASTRFLTVRFGNVLDSSGSVIPLFREQIERGGPVTVTHPDVTRWFMTVPEAVSLILTAATIGRGGEVFVLDMGKPVRIVDLARALIRQYGLRPDEDIAIRITGLRPGERLFEKLFNDHETVLKSSHPRILMALDVHTNGNGASGDAAMNGNGWRSEEFHRLMRLVEGGAAPELSGELHRVVETVEAQCG